MSPPPAQSTVPFAIIVPTVYGQMLVNRHDINQTNALVKTGRAIDHRDIVMVLQILQLLGTDVTALDVGANFGTYSMAMAKAVGPHGKVHAFEPQRLIYNLLVGSVALNSLTNVYCHNVALGEREDRIEIPQFDYDQPLNFGSVEFTPEQNEKLAQTRGHNPDRVEYVPLATIDSYDFPKVHLIKLDAEGMELQVLRGATETIRRCRPVLYVEFVKADREALRRAILKLDYVVHENNMNYLCIPIELSNDILVSPAPPDGPTA